MDLGNARQAGIVTLEGDGSQREYLARECGHGLALRRADFEQEPAIRLDSERPFGIMVATRRPG